MEKEWPVRKKDCAVSKTAEERILRNKELIGFAFSSAFLIEQDAKKSVQSQH